MEYLMLWISNSERRNCFGLAGPAVTVLARLSAGLAGVAPLLSFTRRGADSAVPVAPFVLEEATGADLERRVRATTAPQGDVRRVGIILRAVEGMVSQGVSKMVEIDESHVAMWRQRFLADGLDGLCDAPRRGAKRCYGHDGWMKIAAPFTTARLPDRPVAA